MQISNNIRKRRIISGLLLVLYVMCMTVAYTHHHEHGGQAEVVCADCANHVQHHSHLSDTGHMHDTCVLCQTLVMPLLVTPFVPFLCWKGQHSVLLTDIRPCLPTCCMASQSLRGPPEA